MSAHLEDLLPAAAESARNTGRPPRGTLVRLKALAALLRSAPRGAPGTGRLLWRNSRGDVMALAITRPLTLGRDAACDLAFANPRVSRRHCTVRPGAGGDELADLGSSNGTFVNGVKVPHRALRDGDVVELGGEVLAYTQ